MMQMRWFELLIRHWTVWLFQRNYQHKKSPLLRINGTEDESSWYHLWFECSSQNTPHSVQTHTQRCIGRPRLTLLMLVRAAAPECIQADWSVSSHLPDTLCKTDTALLFSFIALSNMFVTLTQEKKFVKGKMKKGKEKLQRTLFFVMITQEHASLPDME